MIGRTDRCRTFQLEELVVLFGGDVGAEAAEEEFVHRGDRHIQAEPFQKGNAEVQA